MTQEETIAAYKALFDKPGETPDYVKVLAFLLDMTAESREVIAQWHIQRIQEIVLDMVNGPGN